MTFYKKTRLRTEWINNFLYLHCRRSTCFYVFEEKKRLADFCASEKSKIQMCTWNSKMLLAICGGCFLFVHIGLRLPRLRIGKCPTAFFVYIGFVIGRKPSFVINGKNKKDMPAFSSKQSCDLLENPPLGCIAIQSRNLWLDISYGILSFFHVYKPIWNEWR